MRAQAAWWASLALGLTLQTSFLAHLLPGAWNPDFTRSLVLWLALTGLPSGGAWYAFAAGILVDALSGTPLGFTAFLRLAIYGAARPGRNVVEHSPLVFLIGPLAVALETGIVILLKSSVYSNPPDFVSLAVIGLKQAALEVFTVPIVFVVMELASGYRTEWGARLDTR